MCNVVISEAAQGTPAWLSARAGFITGSRAADVVARRKDGKPAAAYADYCAQLVAERLTGQPQDTGVVTAWMQRGTDLEPQARAAVEHAIDQPIFQIGFVARPTAQVGCSVDGFFGTSIADGIVEVKCPKPATHLRYMQGDGIPEEYRPQVLHNLWVTEAAVAIFASFCPQMPSHLQLAIRPVTRERWQDDITKYAEEVTAFNAMVNEQVEYWRAYGPR